MELYSAIESGGEGDNESSKTVAESGTETSLMFLGPDMVHRVIVSSG